MSVRAWQRWLLWKKAEASRDAWDAWQTGGQLTADQNDLLAWAMLEDY